MAFGPGARIEGWSTRPKDKERKRKEALKKVLASLHHRKNLVFGCGDQVSLLSKNGEILIHRIENGKIAAIRAEGDIVSFNQ